MTTLCTFLNHSNLIYFMTNGYGGMLVIVFIMLPYLLYYYHLKEKNLMRRGKPIEFWSIKGSGMLLGGSAMYLYKFISDYIFKLPPIFISIFVIIAFLPSLIKEIKIRNCVLEYETIETYVEPEITLLPKQPTLEENTTVAWLTELAEKNPRFKKGIVVILFPYAVIQIFRAQQKRRKLGNDYYVKVLKGRPVFRWNSAKLKKEIGKIKKKQAQLEKEVEREKQIKERTEKSVK